MFHRLVIFVLPFLISACLPIPQVPPNRHAICLDVPLAVKPGQHAPDLIQEELDGFIDMVGVKSDLDGETLTATFYLREIPKKIQVGREGVKYGIFDYMWTVGVDIDGVATEANFLTADYAIVAFTWFKELSSSDSSAHVLALTDIVHSSVWKPDPSNSQGDISFMELRDARVVVSHQDNTLTLIGEIPGITSQATIDFTTLDALGETDWVSCLPS